MNESGESEQAATGSVESGAPGNKRRSGRGAAVFAALALLIALAAGLGAAMLWYWGEQRVAGLSDRLDTVERSLESNVQDVLLPRLKALKSQQQQLAAQAEQRGKKLDTLRAALDRSRVQISELTEKVEGGHRRWKLQEIESLLLAANERLLLYQSPEDAVQALQLASQRLGALNDPRLFKVRERVADEIAALQALPNPDIEGLSLSLSSLIQQVPKLPLASRVPQDYPGAGGTEGQPDLPQRPWRHFLDSLRQALEGMLTIRRTDAEHRPLLPPRQEFFLQQNLLLKLQSARLALLQRQTETYSDDLASAQQWLRRFFDTDDAAVAGAIDQLGQMRKVQLSWQAPDITGSLTALHRFMREQRKQASAPAGPAAGGGTADSDGGG